MTEKEEQVVFALLEILADCELGKMKLAIENTQATMDADPIITLDKKKKLQEVIGAAQGLGDSIFILKTALKKFRFKIKGGE